MVINNNNNNINIFLSCSMGFSGITFSFFSLPNLLNRWKFIKSFCLFLNLEYLPCRICHRAVLVDEQIQIWRDYFMESARPRICKIQVRQPEILSNFSRIFPKLLQNFTKFQNLPIFWNFPIFYLNFPQIFSKFQIIFRNFTFLNFSIFRTPLFSKSPLKIFFEFSQKKLLYFFDFTHQMWLRTFGSFKRTKSGSEWFRDGSRQLRYRYKSTSKFWEIDKIKN